MWYLKPKGALGAFDGSWIKVQNCKKKVDKDNIVLINFVNNVKKL